MGKQVMIMGVLALSFMLMDLPTVEAQNINFCCWGNSDLHGDAILKKLKNTNITNPAFEVVIVLQELLQQCNPPGGGSSQTETGKPHVPSASISETGAVDGTIVKNGRAIIGITFTDAELAEAAGLPPTGLCKENWTAGDLVASELQAFGTVFTCGETGDPNDPRDEVAPFGNGCVIADQIGQQLCAPQGQPLFQPTADFDYIVKTICDDKTADQCPEQPVEDLTEQCPVV